MNTEEALLNILFYLVSTIISVWFYQKMLEPRYIKGKNTVFMTLAIFVSYLPTCLPVYRNSEMAEVVIDGIQICWEFVVIVFFTTGTLLNKGMAYLVVNISMAMGMLAAYSWRERTWAYVVALTAFFGCLDGIVQWRKRRKNQEPWKYIYAILCSQVAMLCVMYAVGMAVVRIENDVARMSLGCLIIILFFMVALLWHNVYRLAGKESVDERKRMQEQEVRDVLSVYEDVQQQEKELQGLSRKLEQIFIRRDLQENDSARICENETLDYILKDKRLMAQQYHCDMHIKILAEPLLSWDNMDLVSLLTNALDNAIEATAKVQDRERKILVEGQMSDDCFQLIITNPYEGQLMSEEGEFKSTKKDAGNHGYGTRQIKRIAEKYGRTLSVHTENQQFIMKIT